MLSNWGQNVNFCPFVVIRIVSKMLTKQLQYLSGLCHEKMQCFDDVKPVQHSLRSTPSLHIALSKMLKLKRNGLWYGYAKETEISKLCLVYRECCVLLLTKQNHVVAETSCRFLASVSCLCNNFVTFLVIFSRSFSCRLAPLTPN